ncbi:conserved hypothetical protein [Verrucomicrobia bacterium]|nr:conserved hypothetical protein [Verrucomicrobiota bacterium]
MSLTIEIPDEAVRAMNIPAAEVEAELRKELAVVLYARGALSLGKAVEMAVTTRAEFEHVLGQRRIERPFSKKELEHDLSEGKGPE